MVATIILLWILLSNGSNHSTPPELDAGAKFVLVSRGEGAFPCSWWTKITVNFVFWLFQEDEKMLLMNCSLYGDVCVQDHGCTVGIIWRHLLWRQCFFFFFSFLQSEIRTIYYFNCSLEQSSAKLTKLRRSCPVADTNKLSTLYIKWSTPQPITK